MTKVHAIEANLSKVLKIKRGPKDSDQAFMKKLHDAAIDATDDKKVDKDDADTTWEQFGEDGQAWVNAASDARKAKEPLPAYDDVEEAAEEEAPVPKKGAKAAPAKAPAKVAAKVAPAPKEKAAPKAKADAEAKPKKRGVVDAILAYVHKNPDARPGTIVLALKEDGIVASEGTAAAIRSAYRQVGRFLQSKKLLTKELF